VGIFRTKVAAGSLVAALLTVVGLVPATQVGAVTTGTVTGVNVLDGAACPAAAACVAVGNGGSNHTLGKSVVINGATGAVHVWSGSVNNEAFTAAACAVKATSCVALAQDGIASVAVSTGAMNLTATPKAPPGGIVALNSVACTSSRACYAVGFEGPLTSSHAVVLHLAGNGALLKTVVDKGTGIGSIACPTANYCFVADYNKPNEIIQILTGTSLSAGVSMPANTYVQALRCFNQSSPCYALGGNTTANPSVTNELFPINSKTGAPGAMVAIRGFNGTNMTCASSTRCVIVGFTGSGATAKAAVVVVNSGKPGTPFNIPGTAVAGIACINANVCYAVGLSGSSGLVDKVAVWANRLAEATKPVTNA
jgi:hypothetical protein